MPITIGTNIASLNAQKNLSKATTELSSVYERLSSGLRINKASDDAAGLAISEALKSDRRVYGQAMRNVSDGISALSIAEAAITSMISITQRQSELAEQAANGTFTTKQRQVLQAEMTALNLEYNRIIATTKFNDKTLLQYNSAGNRLSIQAGIGNNGIISADLISEMDRIVGTGTFGAAALALTKSGVQDGIAADLNGDGKDDLITVSPTAGDYIIQLSNGDGTFTTFLTVPAGHVARSVDVADINGDGHLDVIGTSSDGFVSTMLGTGTGSFNSLTHYNVGGDGFYSGIGDIDNDGDVDIVVATYASNSSKVLLNNGSGTYAVGASYDNGYSTFAIKLGDMNGDGKLDIVTTNISNTVAIRFGNGDGTFGSNVTIDNYGLNRMIALGDLNGDGKIDIAIADESGFSTNVYINKGDGTFQTRQTYAASTNPYSIEIRDLNGDGFAELLTANRFDNSVSVLIGSSNGTFTAGTSISLGYAPWQAFTGDFNGDGAADLAVIGATNNEVRVSMAVTTQSTIQANMGISTVAEARAAITSLQAQRETLTLGMGAIGAFQSRLEIAYSNLSSTRDIYAAAEARIMDADIAAETANLVRLQILQKAATAVLAQANIQPSLALKLLGVE